MRNLFKIKKEGGHFCPHNLCIKSRRHSPAELYYIYDEWICLLFNKLR
nr:MAG TPA: hypothetical protein [Caudoviricetes sp.]